MKNMNETKQKIYKSDRTLGLKPPENAVHIKTLCTKCQRVVDCYWPPEMDFAGIKCTAVEYMAQVLQSERVGVYCDDCMEKMPDVNVEDLCWD